RSIEALAIRSWNFRGRSQVVIEDVIATALISIGAQGLWTVLGRMRTDDTRRAWIHIGSNNNRINIKWGSCDIGRGVRRRRVRTEKQSRDQVVRVRKISNPTGDKPVAKINRTPRDPECVTLNVAVVAVNGSAIVKIGDHQDLGLVIPCAS